MVLGATVVGAAVWASVAYDALTLWHGAGLWALVVLAFPAFMAFAVKRGWGD